MTIKNWKAPCFMPKNPGQFLCVIWCIIAVLSVMSTGFAEDRVVEGEYIIQRRPARPNSRPAKRDISYSIKSSDKFFELVTLKNKVGTKQTVSRLIALDSQQIKRDCDLIRRDERVRTCEPNVVRSVLATPDDTYFYAQWALDNRMNTDVDAAEAWGVSTGSRSTILGVIDTGIYGEHPDLVENLWSNPNEPIDGLDNDLNGYIDDVYGANVELSNGVPSDCNGHGTHVSGIIGAVGNNGTGISGVNWSTSLIVVSTATDCTGIGTVAASIRAYDYFVALKRMGHNIRAVNASFGGGQFVSAEYDAIQRMRDADILLITAAGNANNNSDQVPMYPANYEVDNIINVGALGPYMRRAYYSNYGQGVDITAPGGDSKVTGGMLYSTWSPLASTGALYKYAQGTSMAAPMVTGAVGLLASAQPLLTGADIKQMILGSASLVPELSGEVFGGRVLNLARLLGVVPPPDNCPSDLSKTEPGVCGCGIADTDANNNGRWDCEEIGVAQLVPLKPVIKVVGRRLVIKMQHVPGVEYYLEVVTQAANRGRRTERSKFYLAKGNSGSIPKPQRGANIRIRYAFRSIGTTNDFSYWSPFARTSIK